MHGRLLCMLPFYFPKRWIMIPKIEPQADAQYIYVKKEAFYKGNFISLMCESFFFAFTPTTQENTVALYEMP